MKSIAYTALLLSILLGIYVRTLPRNSEITFSLRNVESPEEVEIVATIDRTQDAATSSAQLVYDLAPAKVHAQEEVVIETTPDDVEIKAIVDYIHLAESSRGANTNPAALHNICKSQGKSNEFGYGGMSLRICFDTFGDAEARVTRWVRDHLDRFGGDVAKTVCFYRWGEEMVNCQYYQNYLGRI